MCNTVPYSTVVYLGAVVLVDQEGSDALVKVVGGRLLHTPEAEAQVHLEPICQCLAPTLAHRPQRYLDPRQTTIRETTRTLNPKP